jgi:Na+/H+-dicarboxylate symporter
MVAMLVYPLAFVTLVLGMAALSRSWRIGDRKAFDWLVISTGARLALAALTLTPYGAQLRGWLLD